MGEFSKRVRNYYKDFFPIKGRPIPAAEKMDARHVGQDAYFIRLSDKPTVYIKVWDDTDPNQIAYIPQEGTTGACIWRHDKAKEFVKTTKQKNLEIVHIEAVLGKSAGHG